MLWLQRSNLYKGKRGRITNPTGWNLRRNSVKRQYLELSGTISVPLDAENLSIDNRRLCHILIWAAISRFPDRVILSRGSLRTYYVNQLEF